MHNIILNKFLIMYIAYVIKSMFQSKKYELKFLKILNHLRENFMIYPLTVGFFIDLYSDV